METASLITGPLNDRHVALGATMGAFGGWEMPISYAGAGRSPSTPRCARPSASSTSRHLGKAVGHRPGRGGVRQPLPDRRPGRIAPGQAQYTLCCTDDGGVVDDLIAYLVSADEVFLVPNAANTAAVVAALLRAAAPDGVEVVDRHRISPCWPCRGRASAEVLVTVLPGAAGLAELATWPSTRRRRPVRVCRTGYTGEHGYELCPGRRRRRAVWDALLPRRGPLGGRPCGLGARDTLRTEMGYPLHGQDLSPEISPVQAGQRLGGRLDEAGVLRPGRAAGREGGGPGAAAARAAGDGPRRPAAGMAVLDAAGQRVGETTSGTFSPTLGRASRWR